MSEIKRYACRPEHLHLYEKDAWDFKHGCDWTVGGKPCTQVFLASDHDAAIADLKRQLEDVRDRALEEAAKVAAPYHTGSGNDENGCPHLCSLCRERRTIRGAIRALKSNQK